MSGKKSGASGLFAGLLAMFGATKDGTLPKYEANAVSSRKKAPGYVQAWLLDHARWKRERRAASPYCSSYARANVR